MNSEELDILNDIYACQALSQVNLYFINNFKKNEAILNVLPQIRSDFLQFLVSGSDIDTLNEFINRLIKLDPKQAKKIVESIPADTFKRVISKEENAYKAMNLFNLLAHDLYALSLFKKVVDFEILRKQRFSVHDFSRFYGFLYYVRKIDSTFKVAIDFEILSNTLKNSNVNDLATEIGGALINSKEFFESLFGVIGPEKILSNPKLTLRGMEKFLDTIYETDREMFSRIVKENINAIKAKLREYLVGQAADAAELVDFMYKAAPKYAEGLVENDDVKRLIDAEMIDIHEAADFVMVLLKRNPSFGKEFVPDLLSSRAFRRFFNYDEYLKATDARQKLKILHSTLENIFKEHREMKFFCFFSYFARSEFLKIASAGCGSMRLVFPEFMDVPLEAHYDAVFSIGDEALDFNLREMRGSSIETKEDMLLDIHVESEKGGGMELFFERLHEESNKFEEKFNKRHAEYFLKPDTAEKLIILADLFSAMYARHFYFGDVPYLKLIEELGKLAERIDVDL